MPLLIGKQDFFNVLIVIGALFILFNTLSVAAAGKPIVFSAFQVGSVSELVGSKNLWWRLALGFPGVVEGWAIMVWIFIAFFNLLIALLLLVTPGKNMVLKYVGFVLSVTSVAVGGGFIIGLVMCFAGYLVSMQPDRPFEETFVGKIYRAARLDSSFFERVMRDKLALQTGALALVFVNLLSGIGSSIYSVNANIVSSSMNTLTNLNSQSRLFSILFLGGLFGDQSLASAVFLNIGFSIVKWVIFSLIIYYFGVMMIGSSAKFEDVAKVLAFAYAPICLQIFLPVLLVWQWMFFAWPFLVVVVTNFWLFVILVAGLKVVLGVSHGRALGVVIFCGSIYWFFNSVILSSLVTQFGSKLPGIQFFITPGLDVPLLIVSMSAIVAVFLGVFRRYVSI